jgi:predicted Zn-ribbon and HTH transcriptional regulator
MSTVAIITGYVIAGIVVLGLLAIIDERQRRRFMATPSPDHIFRCSRCAYVYTDDNDVDRSRCPQCGTLNEEIKF